MRKALFVLLLILGTSVLAADGNSWIQQAYHKSFHYEQTQNYSAAINALLPVVRGYPKGYTVNLRLGWLYYLMKHYANSIAHYDVAIKTAPTAVEAKVARLLPLLAQERYSEVEQTAYQVLNIDFYNYYGNLRLAVALRKQNKTYLALEVVYKMQALYPADVTFLVESGLLLHKKGERDKAVAVFQGVIVLDPENVTAKSYLGK
jgi:tetratricopeptide (TPR) repeat protein